MAQATPRSRSATERSAPGVAVAACLRSLVTNFATGVVLGGDAGPVMDGVARSDLDEQIASLGRSGRILVESDPASALKLVGEAVAFAASHGIAPHKDYCAIEPMFGDVDAASPSEHFTFGQNVRPSFVPGPKVTPARMREIQRALARPDGSAAPASNADVNLGIVKRFVADSDPNRSDLGTDEDRPCPTIEHEGSTNPPENT